MNPIYPAKQKVNLSYIYFKIKIRFKLGASIIIASGAMMLLGFCSAAGI